jgi:tRNA threonylcarbamoyladenosine biosynthesis protein TsaE
MQAHSTKPMVALRQSPAVYCSNPTETQRIGENLGPLLRAGDVVLLRGELGAGKTCLTQGIARGLGIADWICSPTFILVAEYPGRLRLYHADLYRLDDPEEVADLDLARLSEDGALIVEWPERAPQWLPVEHLLIEIEHAGGNNRRLQFSAVGRRAEKLLAAFAS